jgi:hypothetical protein
LGQTLETLHFTYIYSIGHQIRIFLMIDALGAFTGLASTFGAYFVSVGTDKEFYDLRHELGSQGRQSLRALRKQVKGGGLSSIAFDAVNFQDDPKLSRFIDLKAQRAKQRLAFIAVSTLINSAITYKIFQRNSTQDGLNADIPIALLAGFNLVISVGGWAIGSVMDISMSRFAKRAWHSIKHIHPRNGLVPASVLAFAGLYTAISGFLSLLTYIERPKSAPSTPTPPAPRLSPE